MFLTALVGGAFACGGARSGSLGTNAGTDISRRLEGRGADTSLARNSLSTPGSWQSERDYPTRQLKLLQEIKAQRELSLSSLAGQARDQEELFISQLTRDIESRQKEIESRKLSKIAANSTVTSTSISELERQRDQLALLREIKTRHQGEISSLEGTERAHREIVIERLGKDIEEREESIRSLEAMSPLVTDTSFREGTPPTSSSIRSERRHEDREHFSEDSRADGAVTWSPKVPFYIPGTHEIGAMRLGASQTTRGDSRHILQFMDESSSMNSVRDSITLSEWDMDELQRGLRNIHSWSAKAQREKIRRIFSKTAACFPRESCVSSPAGLSALIVFLIYEDGSTAGQIMIRKEGYQQPYNFSVESGDRLSSHAMRAAATPRGSGRGG